MADPLCPLCGDAALAGRINETEAYQKELAARLGGVERGLRRRVNERFCRQVRMSTEMAGEVNGALSVQEVR